MTATRGGIFRAAFLVGCLMLLLTPVIRGGNRHVALVPLIWLGLLLVLLLLADYLFRPASYGEDGSRFNWPLVFVALSPMWFGFLHLTPVPAALWSALPGHGVYSVAASAVGGQLPAFRSVSLHPDATWASVMAGVPLAGMFLLAYLCSARQVFVVLRILVVVALAQAVIGILQLSSIFSWLQFGAEGRSKGTFGNSNHFANFLAMAIPLAWLNFRMEASAGAAQRAGQGAKGARVVWGIAVFVLLAGVVASSSRAGIATALLALFGAAVLVGKKGADAGQWKRYLLTVVIIVALVLALIAPDLWSARFAGRAGADANIRWQVYASTWHAALEFFPFGSGIGTYAAVFPRFKPASREEFFEYAHNDYLQLFMEGGLLAACLLVVLGWLVVRKCVAMARDEKGNEGLDFDSPLRISLALGLSTLALHSAVDFNTHIPANALVGAFLLGAFLRRPMPGVGAFAARRVAA